MKIKYIIFYSMIILSELSIAAGGGGGLSKVNAFLQKLNTALHGVAIAAVATAIIVSGFKIMFNGDSLSDCKGWIIGAALIAASAEIGSMLMK